MADEKKPFPDTEKLVKRVFEIMGGREAVIASMEAEHEERKRRWDRDVELIGRILRAHLHVEYYLTQHLQHENPKLDIFGAKLTFGQKMNLLREDDQMIGRLLPGIKRLNAVRNRLAHQIESVFTREDAQVLESANFVFMRQWIMAGQPPRSTEPIDILEEFAEHVSSMLHAPLSAHSKAFAQAAEELSKG